MSDMSTLNIRDTRTSLFIALKSNVPIHLIGPPGVGKSEIVESIGKEIKKRVVTLILSQCDRTDVGGFPTVADRAVSRLPWGEIQIACDEGCILFLDELSCAPADVQGAALQLVLNRRAGERTLHPDTRIICASNPADQAAGGWDIALPMISRLLQIHLRPEISEIIDYFRNLGTSGSTIRMMGADFAATLNASPDLISIEPPPGISSKGSAWGAPRNWVRALTFASQCVDEGLQEFTEDSDKQDPKVHPIFMAGLAGNVGDDAAISYWGIRKLRKNLPSMEDICKSPDSVPVPEESDVNKSIAVLGILGRLAQTNPCEAFVYGDRLKNADVRMSVLKTLMTVTMSNHNTNKWFKAASTARSAMLGELTKAYANK